MTASYSSPIHTVIPEPKGAPLVGHLPALLQDPFDAIFSLIDAYHQGHSEAGHLLAMLIDSVNEETGEPMSDQQLRDEAIYWTQEFAQFVG
jgi:hypothetical protein